MHFQMLQVWALPETKGNSRIIGVRGVPERDILSLCVMGWREERPGNSSAVVAVVAVAIAVTRKK